MDTRKAITEIFEAVKPMTVTERSRAAFVQDCSSSGIHVTIDLKFSGMISERNINDLVNHLSSAVLKIVVRNVMRNHA